MISPGQPSQTRHLGHNPTVHYPYIDVLSSDIMPVLLQTMTALASHRRVRIQSKTRRTYFPDLYRVQPPQLSQKRINRRRRIIIFGRTREQRATKMLITATSWMTSSDDSTDHSTDRRGRAHSSEARKFAKRRDASSLQFHITQFRFPIFK
ncbi:hypothetical protein BDP81DRAFT_436793 [Colletotrichum phormii]|uniref:Uncharacterized protein n=1 Tax=Colletotrichum phormii TaxID=359342 RepID=A0AAI9ZI01_9PEZI|nr:uncharacterized protein BDP81DRAFT_436793 [Colletotrichum phormii]KAK1624942.1 hypothetical protein BDP81DRAFT_436793 [Colletotrichum phormii]